MGALEPGMPHAEAAGHLRQEVIGTLRHETGSLVDEAKFFGAVRAIMCDIDYVAALFDTSRPTASLWTSRPGAFGCGKRVVEIILSEHQLACLKAAVPKGSVEHAALEAGDYFAGDEIAPEPVAVTFTCSLEVARQLLAIARTVCPDVATGLRAAIDKQTH